MSLSVKRGDLSVQPSKNILMIFTKNSFNGYKMADYQGGNLEALRQDLLIGADLADKDLKTISRRSGWLSWEDLVEKIFGFENNSTEIPFKELKEFYANRSLLSAK